MEKKNTKIWKKDVNKRTEYYHVVPSDKKNISKCVKSLGEIYFDDSWYTKDECEFEVLPIPALHNGAYASNPKNNKVFIKSWSPISTEDFIDLPAGCYSYQEERYPIPERLEVQTIRSDVFIDVRDDLKAIRDDISTFMDSRALYEDLGMSSAYRRAYLLYGPPGNGKTAQIRNLVSSMFKNDFSVVIWTSGGLPSHEMLTYLNSIEDKIKVIILEEISSKNKDVRSVSDLLEFLDGENSPNNAVIIATTNYPEELQENLVDRPSRFDVVSCIPNLTPKQVNVLLSSLLKEEISEDITKDFKDLSIAHVKEMVLKRKMHNKSLISIYNDIKKSKKKVKAAFPTKESTTLGIGTQEE